MEAEHIQANWRFNRRLVLFATYPTIFSVGVLFAWHFFKAPGFPPAITWLVLAGGVAATLVLSFLFWRCPQCGEILYRTSTHSGGVLFWLADPPDCPYCGVKLNNSIT